MRRLVAGVLEIAGLAALCSAAYLAWGVAAALAAVGLALLVYAIALGIER